MVGTNVKAETMTLMEKRTAIEVEMDAIITRLCRSDGPGLTGNLVDNEGFPRADIDIPAIRADRQRLSVLRNDHKEVTTTIERNLYILHSGGFNRDSTLPLKRSADEEYARPSQRVAPAVSNMAHNAIPHVHSVTGVSSQSEGPCPMDEDASHASIPFAFFDEVTEGSPAALDGLVLGDQLVKFGSVEGAENVLPRLAREGQMNEGRGLNVVVLRRGEPVHLLVTPRQWSGRGLLGCHIQPL